MLKDFQKVTENEQLAHAPMCVKVMSTGVIGLSASTVEHFKLEAGRYVELWWDEKHEQLLIQQKGWKKKPDLRKLSKIANQSKQLYVSCKTLIEAYGIEVGEYVAKDVEGYLVIPIV